ncbi:uncharacterized protein LOC117112288 [Anneissia japonica]|uniref:uncharacterized protein LOC117112288 n=1 Tax=Anneissia japonica TaxID=1529436 RepID=UPI001425615A|nr:uncharacterized protein LOC117112288 [Anneissia japonica]
MKNLRPVILLNTIRKCMSLIVLERIRHKIDSYLPTSKSGFRPGRSTSDVVMTYKWMIAKASRYNLEFHITGIDMSAFDTINRDTLLQVLNGIINEDELRIIRFLLSQTGLNLNLRRTLDNVYFDTNTGVPQGDSLSPVLFTVYLEHALRGIRGRSNDHIPNEISYADDVDFIRLNEKANVDLIGTHLISFNLKVNKDKTEYTVIKREELVKENWRLTKKLGSLLGDKEDITRRKQLAVNAMNKKTALWNRKEKNRLKTRPRLYNSLVKPVLLYNSNTWALTKDDELKLNTFHRKQLRKIIGLKYPHRISNKHLYDRCTARPLSLYNNNNNNFIL